MEYQEQEDNRKDERQDWPTNTRNPKAAISINYSKDDENTIMCLADTKISHQIPRSYKHTMATDLE